VDAQSPPVEQTRRVIGGAAGSDAERELVRALRAGDDRVFAWLVDTYSPALLRLAHSHVPTRAVAEEVVQATWLALVERLDSFEERSSIKTWLFRVLVNIASTSRAREARGSGAPRRSAISPPPIRLTTPTAGPPSTRRAFSAGATAHRCAPRNAGRTRRRAGW
jgi:DNA-directed RNA polymerase specialized sigma24 family protein